MSRPAALRSTSSPFVRRKTKPGSKALGIDWERFEPSLNHNLNTDMNHNLLGQLRIELAAAESLGRYSKVKKLRREISRTLEDQLAIGATWCGGCLNYLHNCRCPGLSEI